MNINLVGAAFALVMLFTMLGHSNYASAAPPPESKCSDGRDNDKDGLIDGADPDCSGGGGSDMSATFTVEVFFNNGSVNSGSTTNVVGKIHGNRKTLEEHPINSVDLTSVPLPPGCSLMFGAHDAMFDATTAKIPPSSPNYTFVTANLRQIVPLNDSRTFGLGFDGGTIDDETNWFPVTGDTTSLTGNILTWTAPVNSGEEDPCNGEVVYPWEISVTGE